MNINRIKADITTAKLNCSPVGNPSNDEFMYDISAYHTQQAVEKCLKYLLHDVYGEDNTTKSFKTHNISSLIIKIDSYDKSFIDNHKDLVDMADTLTEWEAQTRYGEDIVSTRKEIESGITISENLYAEISTIELTKLSEKEPKDIPLKNEK